MDPYYGNLDPRTQAYLHYIHQQQREQQQHQQQREQQQQRERQQQQHQQQGEQQQQRQQQQQQQQQEEEFMLLQSVENSGGKSIDYERLTSFLEVDNSFLTPWNWNPEGATKKNDSRISGRKQRMNFEPGSFFSSSDELPKSL